MVASSVSLPVRHTDWGLRDYSVSGQLGLEPTPEEYVANMVAVFREVRRVLRPDGVCWLNLGDSYVGGGRGGDYGKSTLVGSQSSQDANKVTNAYKGDNIFKPKDLVGIPWRVAFALQADGWWLRSDIIWSKPNPMPESVTDRPTKAHEYIFLLTKSARYFYDAEAVKENGKMWEIDSAWRTQRVNASGGALSGGTGDGTGKHTTRNKRSVWTIPTSPYSGSHFAVFPPDLVRPCILAGSSPRACEKCGAPWERVVEKGFTDHTGNTESEYPKESTAKRLALLRQAARKSGGEYTNTSTTTGWQPTCTCDNQGTGRCIVLDPFAGTFTVGMVAAEYGRRAVGIELNPEYIKLAKERTGAAMAQQVMPL